MVSLEEPIPELGQIVTVRQHRYVVSDVQKSAFSQEVLLKSGGTPQHLVSLTSVKDLML